MKDAVTGNPVTSAVGLIITVVGGWLVWDAELQGQVATLFLAAAVVVLGIVAWWSATWGSDPSTLVRRFLAHDPPAPMAGGSFGDAWRRRVSTAAERHVPV